MKYSLLWGILIFCHRFHGKKQEQFQKLVANYQLFLITFRKLRLCFLGQEYSINPYKTTKSFLLKFPNKNVNKPKVGILLLLINWNFINKQNRIEELSKSQKKRQRRKTANNNINNGLVVSFVESMLTPGIDQGLIKSLNIILGVLFFVLFIMMLFLGSIHYAVMLFFAIGLFLSFNFFLMEAAKVPGVLQPENKN